jgi:hypothetical protein
MSCASTSSFESPNNLRNVEGTVFLTNGKQVDGRLVIQTGSLFGSDVKVFSEGDKKPMHFKLQDVSGFMVNDQHYVLKEKSGFHLGKTYSFMKRLTPENSRIHLYEAVERVPDSGKGKGSTTSRTTYRTEYYIQLQGEPEHYVHPVSGSKSIPDLEEKFSKMISDCPTLSKKMSDKESGYVFTLGSEKERKAERLLSIIHEYNSCN